MNQDFAEFYAAHFAQVAAQLYAYLGDQGEAQDLTQEAFCRALDRWRTVSTYGQPVAWVRQVAWNLARSRLRHLQVVMRHAARERPQHIEGPGPDRVVLVNALAALPANHRLAVVLHHIGDLSTSEIARQHGVAEGTVRSWLSRGRSQLAEELHEWRPQFAPPGVEAAERTVRRRRVGRRSALAGLVLLVVIGFAAVVLRGGRGEPHIIGPTPIPTPTGTRLVNLPGVGILGPPVYTKFIDGRNAWVMLSECPPSGQPPCEYAIGVTNDTGATWRTIALPFRFVTGDIQLEAVDSQAAILTHTIAGGKVSGVWITVNGGRSYLYYDSSAAMPELIAMVRGGLGLRCAKNKPVPECRRWKVVDHRAGTVLSEIPFDRQMPSFTSGKDGRWWIRDTSPDAGWAAVSEDRGQTWQELPWPDRGDQLHLTPDGRGAWVTGPGDGGTAFWELDGDRWQRRMVADVGADSFQPLLLNGGVWLVAINGKLSYLKDSVFTAIPGITGVRSGQVLGDGSVLVQVGAAYPLVVGVGSGTDRTWSRIVG